MEKYKNLFKPESILLLIILLIVISTGYLFFTVDFTNESSVRSTDFTLDIFTIVSTIALALAVLFSQWTRTEEKEKKQKDEKIQRIKKKTEGEESGSIKWRNSYIWNMVVV